MRKAHDTYLTQVERDARKREADRKAEEERLRRNEAGPSPACVVLPEPDRLPVAAALQW